MFTRAEYSTFSFSYPQPEKKLILLFVFRSVGYIIKFFSSVLLLIFCILVTGVRIITESDQSNCPL